MDINILQDLLKIAKELKSTYVYIKGNYIYGVDESFVYLKMMEFNNIYNINISFVVNDMATFIKNVDLNEIKLPNPNLLYSSFDNTLEINNISLVHNIESMINSLSFNMNTSNKRIVLEPVRGLEDFEYILESKSADGSAIFRYNKYNMTIFKNLIPIKKSDKVYLTIYDDIDGGRFLSNFTVDRKKTKIEVYIMYLHL